MNDNILVISRRSKSCDEIKGICTYRCPLFDAWARKDR